ncbi:CDP-diacylglycerol--glycerol-3-phosphate 3-phosphatidyltransferase [Corynebacterium sp. 320]|uniref:CDP-diacylglycerol--glycerol-3-phosphate 3-phosphatidyltransferase n=1 Tax=Corynebacterium zhongnanshanii TaxID=2768834 RepID=A0ABQ6VG34_9CORY|nr:MULTISPECIES: CDP-diacylglycerol--glycerol-3-phosphate 3-phosphatidyltransferase [Corynebacterium]KAB1503772.1 CDP-diacylglycerol--glycerol-3-phosphate 3-phosphatidyltransferase [Corynebacterium sp. 320]KAB1553128.1 CDP-diacylglycerol--glycerol-3-phosphate 3-phosphatidyltransferase [Corynebacterium sp. 321]KAB1553654.1 CDP-diacylglycerol--glycerol-3-phosphate 3-phosphatidyltransferase [Corynebacterium sp. 319]KAB3523377.1 CDP-diacylglycerol--glycerol-3-phosphate 3-phosphatidyltransferase [Co
MHTSQELSRSSFGRFVHSVSLPNTLTVIRIAVIPVFLWLILSSQDWSTATQPDLTMRWWALGVFIALMFTDQLDGFLARRYQVITDFGKLADPIADKALMISAFVSLNILGELWWWVTAVIVVRELGITVWRMILARRGKVVPASKGGKLKTVLQTVAVALFILPAAGFWHVAAVVFMALAVAQTVITGVQYLVDSRD